MVKERSCRNTFQATMYAEHRRNMKEIGHKTDCDPPLLKADKYLRIGRLTAALKRLDEVERDNRHFIQMISRIYRTKGAIDCRPSQRGECYTSNYKTRCVRNVYIERDNELLYRLIKTTRSKYSKQDQLEDFTKRQQEMKVGSRYPEFYETDLINPLEKWTIVPTEEEENPGRIVSIPAKRVKCFLDFEISGERKLGRMFIEIYKDFVPIAGENFLHFVRGEGVYGYRETNLYRIKPKFGFIGGDVENRNGASIISAYGKPFAHENHLLKFAGPGVVAAFTLVPGLNFCQFFISFKALPFLQSQFVVIGRVIKNLRTLEMIEEFGTASGKPKKNITIENCGIWQTSQKKQIKAAKKVNKGNMP